MAEQLIIYQKFYDLVVWLIPVINKIPKSHRLVLGKHLEELCILILLLLVKANKSKGQTRAVLQLNISDDLLSRSLNEGFSGGEKKKMEVLQAAVLEPEVLIFDEIDTGVDVDALRSIARFMNTMKSSGKTFIIITHYNRILKYLRPDAVLILVNGKLVKTGTATLADTIEKGGYDKLKL